MNTEGQNCEVQQMGYEDNQSATLRHDMTNCLTSMRLRLHLLRRENVVSDEHLLPFVQGIAQMETLVREWRQLRQCEVEYVQTNPFDLSDLLRNLVEFNQPYAQTKGQSLTLSLDSTAAVISGHESAVQRAIDNLISNAMKYTPDSGAITVSLEVGEGSAVISIQDNGIGIPEDEQGRVFGAYYRARNALEQDISGTGLGLFQVKDAVERHNGKITLLSRDGYGTRVEVYLPLTPETVASKRSDVRESAAAWV